MNKILQNKKIITHTLIIVAIILLAVISLQAGFAATTHNVDNSTAGGGILGALNTATDDDTIELDEGTYTGNNNTNITINKNITIQGKTKDKVILDAQGLSRIFTINNNLNVTFINITFFNGNTSGHAGAIYNLYNDTMITVTNCTFNKNTGYYGGAIYAEGNITIQDSTFTNNTALNDGGAIRLTGHYYANIIGCNFTNNTANTNTDCQGGAIVLHTYQNVSCYVNIIDSIFNNNTAGQYGGGIFIVPGANNATLYVNIIDSTFKNNNAIYGGGLSIAHSLSNVYVNVTNSNFENNNATYGGGIYVYDTIFTNISGCQIVNNTGDGITIDNGNVTIGDNVINDNTGDGIKNGENGTADITDNEIIGNGGSGVNNDGDATIEGNTINDNDGDGITNGDTGTADIIDNEIVGNGGYGVNNDGDTTISDNTINDNVAGGIKNGENGTVDIIDNEIVGNGGSGVNNDGDATVNDNVINDNEGDDIVNNGTINGSGNANNVQSILTINTTVSDNKITIRIKATDKKGNAITGRLISFYINGKLAGSAITNNQGIAEFVYTASSAGTYNILATMNGFNESDTIITRIYSPANASTIANVLKKGTVITVSTPTINEGKKTNIKVTLKDINGNILKNKKVSLTIKGKTYTATTNNNGIVIFKIASLKGVKHILTAKFTGDSNYKSSNITKVQKVNPKSNLGIVSIKKLSTNKRLSTFKITIVNKGSLKSKATTLALFHIRKGIKIKTKHIKIKSIAPGKKISIIVKYFPDKANHRYCIAHFQVDPKNKNKEIILANNKKSISLKH